VSVRPPRCARSPAGFYLHVPFCARRCAYCSFVTSTELDMMPRAMAALRREITRLGESGGRPLATLYLGGGTPSLLPRAQLEALLECVGQRFPLASGAEVTLEANPDDVTSAQVEAWDRLGITRVSVGCQSFDDRVLAYLNRRHDARQAENAVQTLLARGLEVSLDLMIGLPGLSENQLSATLATACRLRPQHVSVYLLETDKPNALGRLALRRPDLFPDADEAARHYLVVGRTLVGAGYRHYEISNFALPGHAARHNLRYWLQQPVLAAGLGAHGSSGRQRWANLDDLAGYLGAVEAGRAPRAWSRRLSDAEVVKERVMLGLRLAHGSRSELVKRAAADTPDFGRRVEEFLALGLLREGEGRVRLAPRGFLLSNELFAALW
jgi:oxygen-independent coproporphyrinogen III oxidase